jgi:hypothetical protein
MDVHHFAARNAFHDLSEAALIKAQSVFSSVDNLSSGAASLESEEDEEVRPRVHGLQVNSLPRPALPGPMQLFSSTIAASARPVMAVIHDQPSSIESSATLQPQINATFLKTTSAKRISTNDYQVLKYFLYKSF